jgi:hypothetical protein
MTKKEVLLELLDDNTKRIHHLLKESESSCLQWSPDEEANSIAVTLWHVSRIHDVFLTQHIMGKPADDEVWFKSGWAEKAGYDPLGIGTNGWGAITGYIKEEVDEIPQLSAELLLGYYDETSNAIKEFLERSTDKQLEKASIGFEEKYTNYFWIRHALFDLTRHVGEMMALKAMWDRAHT